MSESPRSGGSRIYKDETDDVTAGDSRYADEEAQLLSREELEFEDNDLAKRQPDKRPTGCLGFLRGPQPRCPQKITPFFPSFQNSLAKLLDRLLPRREHQSFFLNLVLVIWLVVFLGVLTTQLPIDDGNGKHVVNLDCTDSLWKRKNECGIDGINCHPFNKTSFAFKCPSKCVDVQLLNPHAVGAFDANYRPLVVGTETYRGDSFICGSAIHAGTIGSRNGGCGRVNLVGEHSNFTGTEAHGIKSIPFNSHFPLSFTFAPKDGLKCGSDHRSALLLVSLVATVILSIFSTKSKVFFPIFTIVFAHISFVSDPPQGSFRNITVLPDHLSMFAKRLLPAFFVAVLIWMTVVKRTLSGLTARIEKTVLWLGGFWIGALSNYTFDWIPISRLTAHDLEQQPGAKLALAVILGILVVIVFGQIYYFWLEGRLLKYLGLYALLVTGILVCLAIPGVNLRIHHYILALLLLPGTSMQTRPSLFYQGILLGLFANGVARWDFDSILQTAAALRDDGKFGLIVPTILEPVISSSGEGLLATFTWKFLPEGSDGISILVNDVERYRAFSDDLPNGGVFKWNRPLDVALDEYFRFAFINSGKTLDYSKAGTILSNGAWTA